MKVRGKVESLELEVTNFGPITQAKLDLRPLTVFIGPSNTGKSYLAILIYALHRYFSGAHWFHPWHFDWQQRTTRKKFRSKLNQGNKKVITDFVDHIQLPPRRSRKDTDVVIPSSLGEILISDMEEQCEVLEEEIRRCFGVSDLNTLIQKGSKGGAQIGFRRGFRNYSEAFEHKVLIQNPKNKASVTIPEALSLKIDQDTIQRLKQLVYEITAMDDSEVNGRDIQSISLYQYLASLIRSYLVGELKLPAFYLPADRTGVMHAHSAVVSSMIESAPMAGLRRTVGPNMLSGVLADFLQQLIGLEASLFGRPEPMMDLGKNIEEAILGGTVSVERSETINYPHFTYKPHGWKDELPLMNASSMVSELAPVVLYLRHLVGANNVLVIEEPESHLHPAMQVQLTRQIATLVKNGVRVIVTTHSEWVLEELANAVRRSELLDDNRETRKVSDYVAIDPGLVGAWLFRSRNGQTGSSVEEVKLDEETGLFPSGFDAVSEALYNESVNIFNRLQAKDSE